MVQWIICIIISFTTLIVNFFIKFLPDSIAPTLGDEDQADVDAAKKDYINLRKKRESSVSIRQGKFIQNKPGDSFKAS